MFDVRARDLLVANFRRKVYEAIGHYPFFHQAEWQAASEGWTLLDIPPQPGDHYMLVGVGDPADTAFEVEQRHQSIIPVPRLLLPREGGVARHLTDLAAFKGGKSYGLAAWATGFAILPDAEVEFIGLEYATSDPEFGYLAEFLCAEPPRGMNMPYYNLDHDSRNGRMRLELKSGAKFQAKSWKQKEQLKGGKKTAYIYTEAYQLPGMVCYTSVRQNLRQLKGFAAFATTPDRPWVADLHDRGHGAHPDWHCTCGVTDSANPVTFDQKARDAADPDKGGLLTREKFDIAHNGQLGKFVGRVYNVPRGSHLFSPGSHPLIFRDDLVTAVNDARARHHADARQS